MFAKCASVPMVAMLSIYHTQTVKKNAKESHREEARGRELEAVKCINDMCYFEYSVPKVLYL